ncbi:MAG TPA: peptidoglycan glycosyltransferase [Candidatus Eubacterium avistercoris]|uniref:Peptidoglycan glycosyltransferase n=1 Tax=Candidatus Eubacterium avistercoris TaxID=2838567 RepID=A0A9D2D1G2_9FIRM|nr:peptidoglycan glycosyltransferase [Candidatus Eubacterium avistercoris]
MMKQTRKKRLSMGMRKKMFLVFFIILVFVFVMIGRIFAIEMRSGEKYEKIVLSQQEYNSQTIPFRRGDILDRKGTILATSTDVYNVVLDCTVVNAKKENVDPTVEALVKYLGLNETDIRTELKENPDSRYSVLAKRLPYSKVKDLEAVIEDESESNKVKGIWLEKEYVRDYPYNTLASSLLGFTTSGNVGIGGIEDYYNETLNGTDGRSYGYLNSDSNFERTIKEAVNGQNVVSTIDANIQSIVEDKIMEFNDAYKDNHVKGNGALHIGVILMDPNNGEVLAMANYPNFDCNNAWDLTPYYSKNEIDAMSEEETLDALNTIWNNFCISYTYEPGSTAKPFTVASGLETGTLKGNETFVCDGSEVVGGHTIHCVSRSGHGVETIKDALMDSCNDALMQMSYAIGPENFCRYQQVFNFGLKTNIDLPGEARTSDVIYNLSNMNATALATNAFGQNFNVTMIQMISAYSSIVNGGSYYQPHVVNKITDENGNTVRTIEPTLLKQTVSEETSKTISSYLEATVSEGTAKTAKVDGYSMCGKTGTAQKLPRADRNYLVSFIGSVPAEDPQVVAYVVVDQPNVEDQPHSTFAQNIAREILEEVLPYMNIYPDEELKGTNANLDITGQPVKASEN